MGPFDFIKAINESKDVMKNDPFAEKDYIPFLVNRGLSFFQDTVIQVNEMNRNHFLDKDMQFQFLLNSIRSKKRYSPFLKASKIKDIECVKEYYGYNNEKARYALDILNDEQISAIKTKLNKGGRDGRS